MLSSQKPGLNESCLSSSILYRRFSTSKKPPYPGGAGPHIIQFFDSHAAKIMEMSEDWVASFCTTMNFCCDAPFKFLFAVQHRTNFSFRFKVSLVHVVVKNKTQRESKVNSYQKKHMPIQDKIKRLAYIKYLYKAGVEQSKFSEVIAYTSHNTQQRSFFQRFGNTSLSSQVSPPSPVCSVYPAQIIIQLSNTASR